MSNSKTAQTGLVEYIRSMDLLDAPHSETLDACLGTP